ncbi:MAG TPA: hypothetical protein VFC19_07995 [Candidatus Limnocylindrales bacterium]|nr:hypothetical protein [Candidatus Limnocylindrales bacterium]
MTSTATANLSDFRVARDDDDIAGMVVGECNRPSRRFLANASGISRQFQADAPAGHCYSTDMFRGLADLAAAQALPDATPILSLASGRKSWSVFALRYHCS